MGLKIIFLLAILFNEYSLRLFDSSPPLAAQTIRSLRTMQIIWLLLGALMVAVSELVYPRGMQAALQETFQRPLAVKLVFFFMLLGLSLFVLETALRPFARFKPKYTTIFIQDKILRWKPSMQG